MELKSTRSTLTVPHGVSDLSNHKACSISRLRRARRAFCFEPLVDTSRLAVCCKLYQASVSGQNGEPTATSPFDLAGELERPLFASRSAVM